MATPWTGDDIPDLSGRTAIVTGANSGLGFESALALARGGADVVLACRNSDKAGEAIRRIRSSRPAARVEALELDLASLASVHKFAEVFLGAGRPLHLLINNAGVMAIPRRTTADGFEMQLGTNHLGHFALTGLLLERLLAGEGARIVTVSSTAHRAGRMNFDDLQSERSYGKWRAYGQSKLANLLFTYELARRLAAKGSHVVAAASHPGYAATELQFVGPRMSGSGLMERAMGLFNRLFSQDAATGALPSLYAATAPDVKGGDYIGPDGFMETWGHPKKVGSSARSHDRRTALRLWDVSQELTGVRYSALADSV